MNGAGRSDAELVAELVCGGPAVLEEIYRRHSGAVYGLACRMRGPQLAEEVTKEVFVALWNGRETYDPERGFLRTNLLLDTHRRAVDALPARTRRRRREAIQLINELAEQDWPDEELGGRIGSETKELLAQVPDRGRSAIVLAYFGGYSCRRIAAILHQREQTIKDLVCAGLLGLRTTSRSGDEWARAE